MAQYFCIRSLFGKNFNDDDDDDNENDNNNNNNNNNNNACASKSIYVIRRRPVNENLWVCTSIGVKIYQGDTPRIQPSVTYIDYVHGYTVHQRYQMLYCPTNALNYVKSLNC